MITLRFLSLQLPPRFAAGAAALSATFAFTALPVSSLAAPIGGAAISPSTSLGSSAGFTIDQIADSIASDVFPWNGFAATPGEVGTIRLDLDAAYDLTSFVLWNDINVSQEGIADFRLDFFDAADAFLGSTPVLQGPLGQVAPPTYGFPKVPGVRRVDLVVLTLNPSALGFRLEIREVAFEGVDPTVAVERGTATGDFLAPLAPNPFGRSTKVEFGLARAAPASVTVHDVAGRRVRTLAGGERTAGVHRLNWNGTDDEGRALPPGFYLVRLRLPGAEMVRRVMRIE